MNPAAQPKLLSGLRHAGVEFACRPGFTAGRGYEDTFLGATLIAAGLEVAPLRRSVRFHLGRPAQGAAGRGGDGAMPGCRSATAATTGAWSQCPSRAETETGSPATQPAGPRRRSPGVTARVATVKVHSQTVMLYAARMQQRTQIYLTEEQRRRIDARMRRDGVSLAAVVREALDQYLTHGSEESRRRSTAPSARCRTSTSPRVRSGTVSDVLLDSDVLIDHLRGAARLVVTGDAAYSGVSRCELFGQTGG